MSAFLVSYNHINAIVNFATRGGSRMFEFYSPCRKEMNAQALGDFLWAANLESIYARYPSSGEAGEKYIFKCDDALPREPIAIIKLLDCLEYQSCEVKFWDSATAKSAIEAIRADAIRRMPEYEKCPWAI